MNLAVLARHDSRWIILEGFYELRPISTGVGLISFKSLGDHHMYDRFALTQLQTPLVRAELNEWATDERVTLLNHSAM